MYSKAEAAQIKKDFWTAFGLYMKPVHNADGNTINWVNYKTGIKNIHLRTDINHGRATAGIEWRGNNAERAVVMDKFLSVKKIFINTAGEDWVWADNLDDEDGAAIGKIYTVLHGVNINNKNDWPAIISFFKSRLLALDEFWCMVKPTFEI